MTDLPTDYFELYEIDPTFFPDRKKIKKAYYALSRELHPDFHTDSSSDEQDKILQASSLVNKAFKTLSDHGSTVLYLLTKHGMIGEGIKSEMPQDFLMEMMELNEAVMETSMDPDPHAKDEVRQQIDKMIDGLLSEVRPTLESLNNNPDETSKIMETAKEYYLKRQYLLRILKNLDNFADL